MLTFDPSAFILRYQDLFMTVGVIVGVGTFTMAVITVTVMLALRSDR